MKKKTIIIKTLFILYIVLMLWLLFGQRMGRDPFGSYWEVVNSNINFIPFKTVKLFIRAIQGSFSDYAVRHSVINLAGNVIMFIPLGFFIPSVFSKYSAFLNSVSVCAISIIIVEIVQLFTLLGSCDIDDFILNIAGVIMGYGIYKGVGLYGKIRKNRQRQFFSGSEKN